MKLVIHGYFIIQKATIISIVNFDKLYLYYNNCYKMNLKLLFYYSVTHRDLIKIYNI